MSLTPKTILAPSLDQAVAADAAAADNVARHGKDFPSLFQRKIRRDQRAALAPASTTTTPRDSPLMIRLRGGKLRASGGVPSG